MSTPICTYLYIYIYIHTHKSSLKLAGQSLIEGSRSKSPTLPAWKKVYYIYIYIYTYIYIYIYI